ncbi:butyrophilin subfamily 1 member A1-like [Fundulus heteroclitus]|uniref:butyrophilin subfamily 1 member A1-like n=1 Tax=Fundulus heteroclitus TaxID=8078 RepID=UPI00165C0AED|nr:butyrophilin subfamily 1 member A1-like [Fundulus heteroclitus]
MYDLYLLFGVLLIKGHSCAPEQPEQVVAFAGENAVLPCSLKIHGSDDVPTVEWSKVAEGLKPCIVFLYRDGCETFEMKDPDFEYRTSLIMREVKNGNVSLRISNVKLSDEGTYRCLIIQKNGTRDESKVKLVVVAVSDPTLSVFANSGVVSLECEAHCWRPAPLMTILDGEGNCITDKKPKLEEDPRGCYNTKQSVTLQEPTSRVICRVEQPQMNHLRTAEILFPAPCNESNTTFYLIIAALVVSLCINLLFMSLWFIKKQCRSDGGKPSESKNKLDQTRTNDSTETNSLLNQQILTENNQNTFIENCDKKNPTGIQIQDASFWKPPVCQDTQSALCRSSTNSLDSHISLCQSSDLKPETGHSLGDTSPNDAGSQSEESVQLSNSNGPNSRNQTQNSTPTSS